MTTGADMEQEEWRPVVGYEGVYEISSRGRLRLLVRGRGYPALYKDRKGYLRVGLYANGVVKTALVHRLVCLAFFGPPPGGCQTGHLNGDPADNRVENLKWVTAKENARHRVLHGRQSFVNVYKPGEAHARAKLTLVQLATIRAAPKGTYPKLAREYGVCTSTVQKAAKGLTWASFAP